MTEDPAALAAIHAAAFPRAEAWSAEAIRGALADPRAFALHARGAFAIGRAVAGEAELLTLAVAPEARRAGLATRLLAGFDAEAAARGAAQAFLEVSEANGGARALYARAGWTAAGRRRGYYGGVDALILRKPLGPGLRGAGGPVSG